MKTAEEVFQKAADAARALYGIPGAYLQLGCSMDLGLLREVAGFFGAKTERTAYATGKPYVIESFEVRVGGVEVRAQGSDEVRPGDDLAHAWRGGPWEQVDLTAGVQ